MTDFPTVRFAPSPTGYLHVGGARTAMFNWLFARSQGGRFLLRIEDTDRERSSEEMTREILAGLRWLGIDWDDDPLLQSSRIERHRQECLRLLAEGKAYWCYCSPQELEQRRSQAEAAGGAYLYDRTCGTLSFEEQQRLDAEGRLRALRFRVPDKRIAFHDIVHDEISFSHEDFDDFILLRSDGTPTYMVAVVVDDHDMGITHVLRGDDHLSNTPKQIALYHALGYETPMFGHLPLILGADKKRLSKRHGATALGEFQQRGYLPGAMFNFLALLGWSPGDDREIMSRDELVNAFDVRRILKKSSVFDEDKLRWMNGQYIRLLDGETLLDAVMRFRPAELVEASRERVRQLLPLFRERMTVLPEFFDASAFLFHEPTAWDDKAVAKYWKAEAADHLKEMLDDFQTISFDAATLEEYIRTRAAASGVGAGKLIHPLRLALTGAASSPGIFEVMETIGRDGCIRRIRRALAALEDSAGAVV